MKGEFYTEDLPNDACAVKQIIIGKPAITDRLCMQQVLASRHTVVDFSQIPDCCQEREAFSRSRTAFHPFPALYDKCLTSHEKYLYSPAQGAAEPFCLEGILSRLTCSKSGRGILLIFDDGILGHMTCPDLSDLLCCLYNCDHGVIIKTCVPPFWDTFLLDPSKKMDNWDIYILRD